MEAPPDPRQPASFQNLPYDILEKITDYLTIEDVNSLRAGVKSFRESTNPDWPGFLRRRLVRQCAGFRPLCFLALLYHFYEHQGIPSRYGKQEGLELELADVSFAVRRLRNSLAVGTGQTFLYETLQSMREVRVLQLLCEYMDTVDDLTDDFFDHILCPGSIRGETTFRRLLYDRRWHTAPKLILSKAERARFQEGFLAYQALCHLCKVACDRSLMKEYLSRLAGLEMERIMSVHDFFCDTWRWIFQKSGEHALWEGNCEFHDPRRCTHPKRNPDHGALWPGLGIVHDHACEGIPLLRWGLACRSSCCEVIVKEGESMVSGRMVQFCRAISEWEDNYYDGLHNPGLGPGEELMLEAQVTGLWKLLMKDKKEPWTWYPLLGAGGDGPDGDDAHPGPIKWRWTEEDVRGWGWAFLDGANFDKVIGYWESCVGYMKEWQLELSRAGVTDVRDNRYPAL